MVQFSETNIAALTLSCATLSLICCSVVALSIRWDPRGAKSYHLILVQSLLRADIGLSLCIILYLSLQYYVSGHSLDLVCRGYLPFVVYFFLVSSGWTVMLALRFRSSQNVAAQFNKPPVPMWAVWAIPLLPAIAILIVSYTVHDVAYARSNSNETNQSCQFDHSSAAGILVDIVCFQAPLIVITFANVYMYVRGLSSLHNAPHSVIARQMKRAGGYLAVLLIVWFPNIGYNLLVTCDSTDEQYDNFLVLTIILQASQGFLNTCVYVYSNRTMMKWLRSNLICVRFTRPRFLSTNSTAARGISIDKHVENGWRGESKGGNGGEEHKRSGSELGAINEGDENANEGDGDEDDDFYDDTQWLPSPKASFSGDTARASRTTDIEDPNQVLNVLVQTRPDGSSVNSDNSHSSKSANSMLSTGTRKSILIPEKSVKNIDAKSKRNSAHYYPDVDSEKFVRFGRTETRTISERTSSTRGSELEQKLANYL